MLKLYRRRKTKSIQNVQFFLIYTIVDKFYLIILLN